MKSLPEEGYCPIRATIRIVQSKWTLSILRELMRRKRRFNELSQAVGRVNSRTLRARLKALEEEGLVERNVLSQIPPWVEYALTPKGESLSFLVEGIEGWAVKWMAAVPKKRRPKERRLKIP